MGISGECIAVRLIIVSIGLPFSSFGILVTKIIKEVCYLVFLMLPDLFHKIVKLVDKFHRQVLIYHY